MLNEEVKKYRELSGDTNPNTSISRIGGYLDGYEKALEQTRWIPCSERLPEGFEPVLFTSKKNGEIAIGYRDPRFKTYWACIDRADWHHTDFDVVAWMPLPEPYQEGEKKMNTIKLMTDVMKAREKDGSRMEWIYSDYTDDRCCVLNKRAIYIVDSYRFYLDVEKTFEKTVDAKKFIDPSNPLLVNAIDTGITRKHEALTCKCLKSENFDVWIDEKYLKYLNKNGLMFMASSPKEPVYVYEDDVFVAVILPVVFKS